MDFIKHWIWGDDGATEITEPKPPPPPQGVATIAKRREPIQPLLREVPGGTSGGVQGLDWFKDSLRKDGDGDCATQFLEESQRRVDADAPAAKQQRQATLQCITAGAVAPTGVSLVVEGQGHVRTLENADSESKLKR